MFRSLNIGAEITSKGIYAIHRKREKQNYYVYNDLDSFLESIPKFSKVNIALARDTIYVRKLILPADVKEHINKGEKIFLEDLFPSDEIEPYIYTISGEEHVEVLAFGIKRNILEALKKLRQIKLLTLSSFIYILESNKPSFKVLRKLPSEMYEYCIFKDKKLTDTFLLYKEELKNKEYDFLIEDEFWIANKLLMENIENNIEFFLVKKEKKLNPSYVFTGINFILFLLILYNSFEILRIKMNINKIDKKISELKPHVNHYFQLVNSINALEKELEIVRSMKSYSLKALWFISVHLPKDTKLIEFHYEFPNIVVIEGTTKSTLKLIEHLKKYKAIKEISLEGVPRNENGLEHFKIRMVLMLQDLR